MNKLMIERIFEVEEEYNDLIRRSKKMNTNLKQNQMVDNVNKYFESLKPLSYDYQVLEDIDYSRWSNLTIGSWFRKKSSYHRYGANVKRSSELFSIIRDVGEQLTDYLRGPIEGVFPKMVKYTKKLKRYDRVPARLEKTGVLRTYNLRSWSHNFIEPEELEFHVIKASSGRPKQIKFENVNNGKTDTISVCDSTSPVILEDFIEDINLLYDKMEEQTEKLDKTNNELLEKIRMEAAPFLVGKRLDN